MELPTIAVFAVAFERLFVVAAALTAIVLGWNLFTRAIVLNQSGSFSFGDWKVELKTVGPGVFFSLFGTIVLVYVLLRPAEYTVTPNAGPGHTYTLRALGVGGSADTIALGYVRAVNTLIQIEKQVSAQPPGSAADLTVAQVADLKSAVARLTEMRQALLVQKFGKAAFDEWQANATTFERQKQALAADLRERLEKIAPWATQTVADDGGGAR